MKLIYQQMISFLLVIITTLAVAIYSSAIYNEKMEYQQTWARLEDYGNSLGEMALKVDPETHKIKNITSDFIENLEQVLNDQSVKFAVFNANNRQTYPQTNNSISLKPDIWKEIKEDKIVRMRTDFGKGSPKFRNHAEMTYVIVPWYAGNHLVGAVWVGSKVADVESNIEMMKNNLRNVFIFSLLAAIIASYFLARYHVLRINRLRAATERIAHNDFDVKISPNGKDEIADLATDFNKMTESLKKYDNEIKLQEQRRKEFMANASHEMKTPLTTINGLLEGLKYDAIPEDSKEKSIDLMRSETNRLIRLVSENLDYEKIRTNQITLNKTNFDAVPVFKSLIEQMNNKVKSAHDELIFIHEDDEIPVYADYDRFVQIFVNIVQNAIQFTEGGIIKIKASRIEKGALFIVSDTGIGMTQEQIDNIFERYYKVDPSRMNTKGESGLGLAIVHQLIEQHRGTIEVESELNKGSSFIIKFFDKNNLNKKNAD